MVEATRMDLYQLTSLVPHWDAGLADTPVTMSFFSRRLPKGVDGEPARGYLLWCGLRRCIEWLSQMRFDAERLETLSAHPMLGPAFKARPALVAALAAWRFEGLVDAPPEGTPLFAGRAVDAVSGAPVTIEDVQPAAQTPYLVVQTTLLGAKLIETPLLSIINHQTMVASKASRVVTAAGDRAVLEFGTRRTHPGAAVDAAYAAYIAGCAGTSNIEAHHRFGVPMLGTMDHFAIQAWEREGVPRFETERAFFKAFSEAYPGKASLLVDTYDAYGDYTGIRSAVIAAGDHLTGIRLDSKITRDNIHRARAMLDALGAPQAKIVVSGGMDEHAIAALGDAPVDAFGIGERIVTSPDAPVGVGAVGKLCEIGGRATMKLARGSAKATLPGRVQVFRDDTTRDVVALHDERHPGRPLLERVWDKDGPRTLPTLEQTRRYAVESVAALPAALKVPRFTQVAVSRKLQALIGTLVAADSGDPK